MVDQSSVKDNDSIKKVLSVTVLLCLVCSVLVASTAIILKQRQEDNKRLDIEKNILAVTGLVKNPDTLKREEVLAISSKKITPALVDLRTGRFYKGDQLDIATYEAKEAVKKAELSSSLSRENDPALIKRREHYAKVFLVKNSTGDKINVLVLPVRGYGLWSTLYGFLALKGDFKTVQGLTFYEHGETPGLGGEVDNPRWKGQWEGKQVFSSAEELRISVVKGGISQDPAKALHQVDAISGATLTSRGVDHLINYWLGSDGFGLFLKHLKKGDA